MQSDSSVFISRSSVLSAAVVFLKRAGVRRGGGAGGTAMPSGPRATEGGTDRNRGKIGAISVFDDPRSTDVIERRQMGFCDVATVKKGFGLFPF